MSFEKPQITPRRRIEVPEEARREARAGMGGEATRAAAATPASVEAKAPSAPVATPIAQVNAPAPATAPQPAVEEPEVVAPAPIRTSTRGRKPAVAAAPVPEADVPLHTVQVAKNVVQEIKMSLLLVTPGPGIPTNIKNYIEAAHRHYDAHLRKIGKLPPAK
jgi:hypothetical protein